MAGMIKYLQSFRFKGLTVILGVFLAISVVLWTERSGIQYQAEIKKKAYLNVHYCRGRRRSRGKK